MGLYVHTVGLQQQWSGGEGAARKWRFLGEEMVWREGHGWLVQEEAEWHSSPMFWSFIPSAMPDLVESSLFFSSR
ncbi:unnamed protein product [Linum trigynum]|uniref:Uncharacterized protein n=1 Tax=Linum trigynum TaxID=586398 RepID=A0AAV2EDN7_9ROSI